MKGEVEKIYDITRTQTEGTIEFLIATSNGIFFINIHDSYDLSEKEFESYLIGQTVKNAFEYIKNKIIALVSNDAKLI
jgi:hypothetical protein